MATVIIRKHPRENAIQVEPEIAVLKPREKLTFKVSGENGWQPGTKVTVKFQRAYRVIPVLAVRRAATKCGPFALRSGDTRNPEDGKFEFNSAENFETGAVEDLPWPLLPHVWKYDVSWT
ncbi:MAG: hypothetical protein ACRD21_14315, partial [Vicinamibacteria bacterium]